MNRPVGTNLKPATDNHDWRDAMQPGYRAWAIWSLYWWMFPPSCLEVMDAALDSSFATMVPPPYPRRRLSFGGLA